MKKLKLLQNLFLTAFIGCSYLLNAQISVDNKEDTNPMFKNLQEAVNAAKPGDTIYVHSSTISYGSVEIDKQVVLLGRTQKQTRQ